MKGITIVAALLAALASSARSEEPPPPMQPRSAPNGPMWIAITKAKCGKYQAVLWGGVNGEQSFWRLYNFEPTARNRKRVKEVEGELYLDGKKCSALE
jgi:hypothetical protein